jgi:hypothetical protein
MNLMVEDQVHDSTGCTILWYTLFSLPLDFTVFTLYLVLKRSG